MSQASAQNGRRSSGAKTANGLASIAVANVKDGSRCFTPVLPGERQDEWIGVLDGLRQRFNPADRLEEQLVYHLALSLWQALRLHKYEKAALRKQMEEASEEGNIFGNGDALTQVLTRGVESIRAELGVLERVLGLIGLVAFADDTEPLEKDSGLLLLRFAVELMLKGNTVEQAFTGLPNEDWTWATVRENLNDLAEASGKSVPGILKTLHKHVLEELENLRETLEKGAREIEANYTLRDGETERLLLYHSRVQSRISKWLALLGLARDDRLGVTTTRPIEMENGDNGDADIE
jgi:hypothetical protein